MFRCYESKEKRSRYFILSWTIDMLLSVLWLLLKFTLITFSLLLVIFCNIHGGGPFQLHDAEARSSTAAKLPQSPSVELLEWWQNRHQIGLVKTSNL